MYMSWRFVVICVTRVLSIAWRRIFWKCNFLIKGADRKKSSMSRCTWKLPPQQLAATSKIIHVLEKRFVYTIFTWSVARGISWKVGLQGAVDSKSQLTLGSGSYSLIFGSQPPWLKSCIFVESVFVDRMRPQPLLFSPIPGLGVWMQAPSNQGYQVFYFSGPRVQP